MVILFSLLQILQGSPSAFPFNLSPTSATAINLDSGRTNIRVGDRHCRRKRLGFWGQMKRGM